MFTAGKVTMSASKFFQSAVQMPEVQITDLENQMTNKEPSLDGGTAMVVNVEYITQLKAKMNSAYQPPKNSWGGLRYYEEGLRYYEEDLRHAYVKNTEKNDSYRRHNPFNLRLPFQLEGYDHLYDHTRIHDTRFGECRTVEASKTYLNFLREYNYAYITYLEAIKLSDQAIKL